MFDDYPGGSNNIGDELAIVYAVLVHCEGVANTVKNETNNRLNEQINNGKK